MRNQSVFAEYLACIQTKQKAAIIAVCRGKLAEGIDFADSAARCVVMAGVPYAQVYDPKVIIKRSYLDTKKRAGGAMLGGQDWYRLQAQRAVNQAIGRVIRNADDWGAIVLLDSRYQQNGIQVSKWLEPSKKIYT